MPKRNSILLAMENLSVSHLMERGLRAASYEPVPVLDLASLNQVLLTSFPDLAVIGERFDGVSGGKLILDILDRFPTMPILAYLEKETPEAIKELWSTGAMGYLSPPLSNDEIVEVVERSLKRARHLGDWVRAEVKRTTASLERRAKLSESELGRYEKIIENVQDGIIIVDEAGDIMLLNKTIIDEFQLGKTPWKEKPAEQVFSHPDMQALFKRAKTVSLKYHEINIDDDRVFNAQYTFIPGVGAVITMQDVSYLKRLDRIKSDFVHTVSHELRSPLTSVLGYAELIRRVGSLSKEQQEFLERIRFSVDSITIMVDDLLGLSRLEAGFDMRREAVQMDSILAYTLDSFESQFKLAEIQLNLRIEPDLPYLRANPSRLRQMLDNLIGNAIKYSPKGGVINIDLNSENDQVIFMVEDSGIGIPKEEQTRIFDKFYRATNASGRVDGTGLGLSIVKSIVTAHQGRIWVESTEGKGAKFFVVLPAEVPDEQE